MGREVTVEEEEAALKADAEMSIDDLRKMYSEMEEMVSSCEEEASRMSAEESSSEEKEEEKNSISAMHAADNVARTKQVSRPFILSKSLQLRNYQHQGLQWLVSIQSRRLNGILADEMGLGKTVQTISCLAYLAAYKGIWGPHLIIVPTSCLVNWEMECKKFCPALKVLTYYGSAKRRKELRTGWTKPNMFHVCVTSYQLAVQDR